MTEKRKKMKAKRSWKTNKEDEDRQGRERKRALKG